MLKFFSKLFGNVLFDEPVKRNQERQSIKNFLLAQNVLRVRENIKKDASKLAIVNCIASSPEDDRTGQEFKAMQIICKFTNNYETAAEVFKSYEIGRKCLKSDHFIKVLYEGCQKEK